MLSFGWRSLSSLKTAVIRERAPSDFLLLCVLYDPPCSSHWRAHPWAIPMLVGVEESSALQLHPLPMEMSWENVFLRFFLLTCYENTCDQLCIFMVFWLKVTWEYPFSHYFQQKYPENIWDISMKCSWRLDMTKVACVILFFLPAEIWVATNISPLLTFLLLLSFIQVHAKWSPSWNSRFDPFVSRDLSKLNQRLRN